MRRFREELGFAALVRTIIPRLFFGAGAMVSHLKTHKSSLLQKSFSDSDISIVGMVKKQLCDHPLSHAGSTSRAHGRESSAEAHSCMQGITRSSWSWRRLRNRSQLSSGPTTPFLTSQFTKSCRML